MKSMQDAYWTEQIDIQRRVALAWGRSRRGRRTRASPRSARRRTPRTPPTRAPISPGPIAPARELLGYMLLDAGRAADALAAFEATMKKEPNRFRGLYGGGKAAEMSGDRGKAMTYYKRLLEVAAEADTQRPEIVAAKKFVG